MFSFYGFLNSTSTSSRLSLLSLLSLYNQPTIYLNCYKNYTLVTLKQKLENLQSFLKTQNKFNNQSQLGMLGVVFAVQTKFKCCC